ncbi:MAG TPA: hypothetical protein VK660_06095 [Xanthomonadaceae bacterium]|jgi:hypothetical protein|nr:hypothetical protein [Xanthomonadaceae bacterium]
MTTFEFVFSLISVITSLALTRLLNGCIALFRHAGPVRWSWRHAGWVAIAYMLLVGNWAAFWRQHTRTQWHVQDVLLPLVFLSVLYAFCDLVMPDKVPDGETLDLREYHQRHGKRYVLVQLVFALQALLVIAIEAKDFGHWLDSARFAIIAVILSPIALRARSAWLDTVAAVGLVVLAAVFMVARLQGLSA